MACKSQKVSVRYLLMALQLLWNGLKSRRNGEILDPEFVLWMCNVGERRRTASDGDSASRENFGLLTSRINPSCVSAQVAQCALRLAPNHRCAASWCS
jgi:hypothetical protein